MILAFVAYVLVTGLWVAVVHPREGVNALADVKHESAINVALTVFQVAVSAPLVEEIFFRGLLYRSLRNRLALLPAALIAGAMFGLVHITSYPLDTLPVKAAFGVIACLLYERTGSLLPGIALHSFVDASSIDVSLTGNDLIVLGSFVCLAVVLLVRGCRQVPTRAAGNLAAWSARRPLRDNSGCFCAGRGLCGEAFGLVAEEEAVDEAFDEFFVLVCEALGGF